MHNHDLAFEVIKILKSTIDSLYTEMPLHIHNESMFGGYCVKTAKQKAFFFLDTKEKTFGKKQRQAPN